jgi:Zn ribbon nucleic-acid-binding protein
MKVTEHTVLELPKCPKCGAEDSMEHCKVRVPDVPLDADWDECMVCGYRTDPE